MNTISISQEELKHVRFPSNQSVIVGDKLLKYSSSILMMDELRNLAFSTRGCSEPIPEYPLHYAKQVEKIDRNSFEASTKTVEEMFDEANTLFMDLREPYDEKTIKIASANAPAFLMELYGLEDAFYYALKDTGKHDFISRSAEEDLFDFFCGNVGYWWLADLCDVPRALTMMRKFFDSYIATAIDIK